LTSIPDENEPPTPECELAKTMPCPRDEIGKWNAQAQVWSCHTVCHSRANAAQALSSKNIDVRLPSSSSDNIGGLPPPISKTRNRRVRFNSELNEALSVTPYSQVYGVHPRFFYFDREGEKMPF
jgi:hypothetical protein